MAEPEAAAGSTGPDTVVAAASAVGETAAAAGKNMGAWIEHAAEAIEVDDSVRHPLILESLLGCGGVWKGVVG
jgi:hypothetical protein